MGTPSWDITPDASRGARDERPDESTPRHAWPNGSDPERVSQVQQPGQDSGTGHETSHVPVSAVSHVVVSDFLTGVSAAWPEDAQGGRRRGRAQRALERRSAASGRRRKVLDDLAVYGEVPDPVGVVTDTK